MWFQCVTIYISERYKYFTGTLASVLTWCMLSVLLFLWPCSAWYLLNRQRARHPRPDSCITEYWREFSCWVTLLLCGCRELISITGNIHRLLQCIFTTNSAKSKKRVILRSDWKVKGWRLKVWTRIFRTFVTKHLKRWKLKELLDLPHSK